MPELGQKIRNLRKLNEISTEEACNRLGCTKQYLLGLERGQNSVSLDNLFRICFHLDIDIKAVIIGINLMVVMQCRDIQSKKYTIYYDRYSDD